MKELIKKYQEKIHLDLARKKAIQEKIKEDALDIVYDSNKREHLLGQILVIEHTCHIYGLVIKDLHKTGNKDF